MGLLDIVKTLQQYSGADVSNPPATTHQDYETVAQSAPQSHLASALGEAFRSDQTPAFPQMLSTLFSNSNGQQRAGILNQLLGALGPGAAGSLGGLSGGNKQITPEQAQQIPPEQVHEMAEQAQRTNPSIVDQASSFYAQHPTLVQALGAGSLALIMSHISRKS